MKKNLFLILVIVLALFVSGCFIIDNETETSSQETEVVVETEDSNTTESENTDNTGVANIIHVTDDDYHDIVDNSEGIAIVDFWATWCPPCNALAPILEEISAEEGITIYKVDVDENPKLAKEFRIQSIPMVYFYKDGEVVDSQLGLGTKEIYLNIINKYR